MPELDMETNAMYDIRRDELCCDLNFDVMKEFALLRASKIILSSFSPGEIIEMGDIVQYAIHLSRENEKSAS